MGPASSGRMLSGAQSLAPEARARATPLRFDAKQPAAAEIIRLAGTLPSTGQARLERLRGFGASFGRTLTCVCSRFLLADGSVAVLVIANEPAGPSLALGERVKRLFSDQTQPLAAFAPDGTLLSRHFGSAIARYRHANITGAWARRDRVSGSRGWQRQRCN